VVVATGKACSAQPRWNLEEVGHRKAVQFHGRCVMLLYSGSVVYIFAVQVAVAARVTGA
jgi:hypothetical protein